LKICDLTQFYSPLSGGVKRYVQEKIAFIQSSRPDDEHILIIPDATTELTVDRRSRIYSIRSPLVSRRTQYRALLNLRAVEEIIERERPDIIESSDPYQVGAKARNLGHAYGIPVVGFYHSHFIHAYLRGPARRLGLRASDFLLESARGYVRHVYNHYAKTLVPSRQLAQLLADWGVRNTRVVELGVNTRTFHPRMRDDTTRSALGIPEERTLLLYVGRLAAEKNTQTLFDVFARLVQSEAGDFHLLVVGEGQQRDGLKRLEQTTGRVAWVRYCSDPQQLAQYYCAADLFVHPGTEETFGLVALESQACGTPVVGIRGSYMDDVIHHDQSAWADSNNAEALTDAIVAMCAQDLPATGAAAAITVAERYAWPEVFARLFSIYREVFAR
jgi:alpha-1,6-mannosyltransferase